jgi:hypothetical protein
MSIFTLNVAAPGNPGGAIRGYMAPASGICTDKRYTEYENIRFSLVQAWNTTYPAQLRNAGKKRVITPFRAVNNAGDLLSRQYYSCGGSSQAPQSRPGLRGLKIGSIFSNCDGTGVPPATCNPKYVYDSSNYTTYLKQQALNKNYNDLSFGGDNNNASQSAYRAIRRY